MSPRHVFRHKLVLSLLTCVGCWIFQLTPGLCVSVLGADPPSPKSGPATSAPAEVGKPLPAEVEALFRKIEDSMMELAQ